MKQLTEPQVKEYMDYVRQTPTGSKFTPEQLIEYEHHIRETAGPEAKGFNPDKPEDAEIFSDDVNRIQAGFGDPEGIGSAGLLSEGYSAPKRNKDGDLIAQGPNGKWYKDANSLFKHPINWMESAVGGAPGMAGMVVGGAAGGGAAGLPGALAGGGAGSAAGEALRQQLGKLLGVHSGKGGAQDILNEGISGVAAEAGGRVIGKVAAPVIKPVINKASGAWAKLAGLLSGRDSADVLRTIQRRGAVFNPKSTQEIAKDMASELAARGEAESATHRAATEAFHANGADDILPTDSLVNRSAETLARYERNGTLSPKTAADLSARSRENLITPQVQATATSPTIPEKMERRAGDILRHSKSLSDDVGAYYDKLAVPSSRIPSDIAFMEGEAGASKDLIHQHFPEMASADARFHDYANKSKLVKPVLNEGTQQGFVDTLINSDKKDNARDAAKALMPTSYEMALDLGANREWKKPGDKLFGVSKRLASQLAIGALGAEAARETHSPWTLLPAAALAAAISPRAHLAGIKYGPSLLRQIPAAAAKRKFSPYESDDRDKEK